MIVWPLIERTKDSRNLIDWKPKFVHWALTLKDKWQMDNAPQNVHMTTLFVSFCAKISFGGGNFVHNINS
jgi:hypothetical protein